MAMKPVPRETIEERIALVKRHGGNITAAANETGIPRTTLQSTMSLARREGIAIPPPFEQRDRNRPLDIPGRVEFTIENGIVLIGSDAHYHPGIISTAHRAFVKFCRELRPTAVIMNGDMLDGASISRHPPLGWTSQPSLIEEIEAVKDRLGEIVVAADTARRWWCAGNHDSRFEMRLASVAPEFAKVHGTELHHHFPDFEPCWSVFINGHTVIKHRARGGIYAPRNNTLNSGLNIITGHLHSLKVMPFTDYRDSARFGVDCGTMAEIYGPQFAYMEDGYRDWRSGFVVLTFRNFELLWPDVVFSRRPGEVEFRGEVISV